MQGDLSSGQSRSSFPVEYVDKVPCKAGRTFTGASEFVCDEVEVWEIRLPVPELDEPTP